jgi:hypothetical protein
MLSKNCAHWRSISAWMQVGDGRSNKDEINRLYEGGD